MDKNGKAPKLLRPPSFYWTVAALGSVDNHRTAMHWYWEAGHYKKELGELVIARIMGADSGFALELTADNIETALASIRQSREAFAGALERPAKAPSLSKP